MPRLIEVQDPQQCTAPIWLRVGDGILFAACGGQVAAGGDIVEFVGPFLPAVLGTHGQPLEPAGSPNTLFCHTHRPGHVAMEVFTGVPGKSPRKTTVRLIVEE